MKREFSGYAVMGTLVAVMLGATVCGVACSDEGDTTDEEQPPTQELRKFEFAGLSTDPSLFSIDLDLILSGGPGKDGIPALSELEFVDLAASSVPPGTRGVFAEFDEDRRYYPFNILVWHEVANDTVGGREIAVTFCPLCGSAVVFDRRVDDEVLEFGVSGLLYQSNLLMYDRATESLWSQALGEAVVGEYTGTVLEILPVQFLTIEEVTELYPDTRILSEETGHDRDYRRNPYAGYEDDEELYFPVSIQDQRFPAKTLMYVVRIPEGSVALEWDAVPEAGSSTQIQGHEMSVSRDGGETFVEVDGERVPGHIEMWFSWATQHAENGHVWEFPDAE